MEKNNKPEIGLSKTEYEHSQLKIVFLDNLLITKGNISQALKLSNVTRPTYNKWLKEDDKFKYNVWEVTEEVIEGVESQLMRLIYEKCDFNAIKYFLSKKGSHKGWGDNAEVKTDKTNIVIKFGNLEPGDLGEIT